MIALQDFLADEQADVAAFIETLDTSQLSTRSLCDDWTVGQVAAHLVANLNLTLPAMIAGTLRAGFRPNRFISQHAHTYAHLDAAALASEIRAKVGQTRDGALDVFFVDTVVHQLDMRGPLGIDRAIPTDRLTAALDTLVTLGFPFGGKTRAKGLRFGATDLDWTLGEGPAVRGPAVALLLALAGRPAGLADLSGDGVDLFAKRVTQ